MPFKPLDEVFQPDPRHSDMVMVCEGAVRSMTLEDHHAEIETLALKGNAPPDVRQAFDRARNILIYAWFDYDFLVIGETQAFGAFELAIRLRLNAQGCEVRGTLRTSIDRARKLGILPPCQSGAGMIDSIEALLWMRNALSHGTIEVHSPGMAWDTVSACGEIIDVLFP